MAPTFQTNFFEHISLNENAGISSRISPKSVPYGPTNNNTALVLTMAWRRLGDKPLSEPMMAELTDAYMRPVALMSLLTWHFCAHDIESLQLPQQTRSSMD